MAVALEKGAAALAEALIIHYWGTSSSFRAALLKTTLFFFKKKIPNLKQLNYEQPEAIQNLCDRSFSM